MISCPSKSLTLRLTARYALRRNVTCQAPLLNGPSGPERLEDMTDRNTYDDFAEQYSAIDSEWPQLEKAFVTWLAPDNFGDQGTQRSTMQG